MARLSGAPPTAVEWIVEQPGPTGIGYLRTPVGGLLVVFSGCTLISADWVDRLLPKPAPLPRPLAEPFQAAWEGRPSPGVKVWGGGLSEFHRVALVASTAIPYGSVMSYGALADWIGFPRHARHVGAAMKRSPLPILFATHRVVRCDGTPAPAQRGGRADRLRRFERDRLE